MPPPLITCTDCGHVAPLAKFVDHYCPPVDDREQASEGGAESS